MAFYARRINGEFVEPFPYGLNHLRKDNPEISFPKECLGDKEFREGYGIVLVEDSAMPTKQGWKAERSYPIDKDGKWVQNWDLVPKLESELQSPDLWSRTIEDSDVQDEHGNLVKMAIDGDHSWSEENQRWEREIVFEDLPYHEVRRLAYGLVEDQIEFITENGLEAWQAKASEIKGWYPKS